MYDTKALAQRRALTALFWASLLTFIRVGAFGLFIPPLLGWPAVAVALARLRSAGPDDDRYQRRLLAGVVTAWLALVVTVAGVLPSVWFPTVGWVVHLVHLLFVTSAMVRFGDLRAAQAVHGRWIVARRLVITMVALSVVMFLTLPAPGSPSVVTVVVAVLLVWLTSAVMYLGTIWATRGYVERSAQPAPPGGVAGIAISG